ncbi:DUF309 domain-containing protein [Haladaptatus sp. ZSTT2]|uniref:DUF309 domain-containing protein n=1 Tax=Haladaptatus sp. ZSTT2 TaxID=3120515 RepID=UPI00300E9341
MDDSLRAGIAIYNAGEFHAAHDAWEDEWLELEPGSDDERLLHGLIQFTAAVHHATRENWEGMAGLVASAREYLTALPADYRRVNVGEVRAYLAKLETSPRSIDLDAPLVVTYDGEPCQLHHLDFPAAAIAARILADELGYDDDIVAQAVAYASEAIEKNETNQFITLVMDFAANETNRPLVFERLSQHVAQRNAKVRDVEGLFD